MISTAAARRALGLSGLGDVIPTAAQVTDFRENARTARQYAEAGERPRGYDFLARAERAFAAMGSPSAYSDELAYTRSVVEEDPNALASVRDSRALIETGIANASAPPPGFGDTAREIGFLPTLFVPFFALDKEIPGEPLSRGTEQAAATGRAFGLPGMDPQSGRDLTTQPLLKPPVSAGAAAGTVLGFSAGYGLAYFMTRETLPSLAGGVAGGALGYALGRFLPGGGP